MSNLYKLGLRDLPLDEAILIKTIFRLSSEQLAHAWEVVDGGPVDAWIADSASWDADLQHQARGQSTVPTLYLSRLHNADIAPILTRPIRAHALVQWLSDTASQLPAKAPATAPTPFTAVITAPAAAAAIAAPAPVSAQVSAPTPAPAFVTRIVESVTPNHDPWAATEPAGLPYPETVSKAVAKPAAAVSAAAVADAAPDTLPELPAQAENAAAQQLDPDSRYLLRRWPPAQIMGNDPKRLRITSLLSKQALQVDELSNLSGASVEECEGWMSTLLHSELLDTRAGAVPSVMPSKAFGASMSLPAAHVQAPSPAMAMAPKRTMSLVSAIRRRLGI